MESTAINTVVKMLETLPESVQDQVVEHIREYIVEMQDEAKWDKAFKKSQKQLIIAAKNAKKEVLNGQAIPMDHKQL